MRASQQEWVKATFGAGCFWGVEAAFRAHEGVRDVVCGYAGGHTEAPDYPTVCRGETGHAEVVQVSFDPAVIGFEDLLAAFWEMHDATEVNRQGPDVGSQYRSVVLFHSDEQREQTEMSRAEESGKSKYRGRPLATEIAPLERFYPAEAYHQNYLARRRGEHV